MHSFIGSLIKEGYNFTYIEIKATVKRENNMSFCYDPFWKLVDSKGLSKMDVMNKTGISSTTLSRLSKNENVSMSA